MNNSSLLTLEQIIHSDFPRPRSIIKELLNPSEIGLLIARQKEGKSILGLQLGIDVSLGDPFLGSHETNAIPVLGIDYENRFHRLKERGIDLANGRRVENLYVKAFDYIWQRDVGLFGQEYERLKKLVSEIQPGLLIIDPLRYALNKSHSKSTSEESLALAAIDQVSALQEVRPEMATILIHHVKKRQDFSSFAIKLRDDPRAWIEQVYGSQALLAHVDSIWGLEQDGDGYTFATVARAQDSLLLRLEKQPDSERFFLSPMDSFIFKTAQQRSAWERLPEEFGWREGTAMGITNNVMNYVIRQARAAGLLVQDPLTKRYRKVSTAGQEKVGA